MDHGSAPAVDYRTVCVLNARRAIEIEIEERYCEIGANRLRQGVLDLQA